MGVCTTGQFLLLVKTHFNSSDLVLEIYGRIEVRYFRVDGFADDFAFASVQEGAHFCEIIRSTTSSEKLTHLALKQEVRRIVDSHRDLGIVRISHSEVVTTTRAYLQSPQSRLDLFRPQSRLLDLEIRLATPSRIILEVVTVGRKLQSRS